jgi:tRNA nucleotidyltransferase/poly(A) polymerase
MLEQMANCGLLQVIIPEIAPLQACLQNEHHSFDVWTHTVSACKALEALIAGDMPGTDAKSFQPAMARLNRSDHVGLLKLALLLHDIGKPVTRSADSAGRVHFCGHGRRGSSMAVNICRRLKLSRRETDYVCSVIRHHNRPLFLFRLHTTNQLSQRAVTRFYVHAGRLTPDVLLHAVADFFGKHPSPGNDFYRFAAFAGTLLDQYLEIHTRRSATPELLTGHDLISELGLAPSPLFKKILSRVEEARLAGEITDKKQALDLARHLIERLKPSS